MQPTFEPIPMNIMPYCYNNASTIFSTMQGRFCEALYSGNPYPLYQQYDSCSSCEYCPHAHNPACSQMIKVYKEFIKHNPEDLRKMFLKLNTLDMMG